ncbi:MAG: hypothetical protein M1383_05560 [Patescibacteria group bacterium]|nr:hypothetical protein [Patescibacteria group bacterium]
MKKISFNTIAQAGLTAFTVLGFVLTAFKLPQYGLIAALVSQIFWVYSSYKAWREANQIGIFITTIFIIVTIIWGLINYWAL